MSERAKLRLVAAAGAVAIAAAGFGAAAIWGEGAGMPVVALGACLWTAAFVRWSVKRRRS